MGPHTGAETRVDGRRLRERYKLSKASYLTLEASALGSEVEGNVNLAVVDSCTRAEAPESIQSPRA